MNKKLGLALLGLAAMTAESRANDLQHIPQNYDEYEATAQALDASQKEEEERQFRAHELYLDQELAALNYYADQKAKKDARAVDRPVKNLDYNGDFSEDEAILQALEASQKEEKLQLEFQKRYLYECAELKYYADQKAKKDASANNWAAPYNAMAQALNVRNNINENIRIKGYIKNAPINDPENDL